MIAFDVAACPRCAGKHEAVQLKPLKKPFGRCNYFGQCPSLKEPIMACVTIELEYTEAGETAAAAAPPPPAKGP